MHSWLTFLQQVANPSTKCERWHHWRIAPLLSVKCSHDTWEMSRGEEKQNTGVNLSKVHHKISPDTLVFFLYSSVNWDNIYCCIWKIMHKLVMFVFGKRFFLSLKDLAIILFMNEKLILHFKVTLINAVSR